MSLTVRPVEAADHGAWNALYGDYAAFYGVEQTEEMRARVWGWLMDGAHEVSGFCAEVDGTLVGIPHCRVFARPVSLRSALT